MNEQTHEPIETLIERLIEQYGQDVYKIAYLYVKEKQLAEDVYQEVFYKVMKHYHKFNHQSSEKTWLIRITINTAKDILKSSWFRRVTTFAQYDDQRNDVEQPYDIEKVETNNEVYEAIIKLPDKYKEVILLYYYEDYSYEEISNILNVPQGTVQSRLSRGKEKLKTILSR